MFLTSKVLHRTLYSCRARCFQIENLCVLPRIIILSISYWALFIQARFFIFHCMKEYVLLHQWKALVEFCALLAVGKFHSIVIWHLMLILSLSLFFFPFIELSSYYFPWFLFYSLLCVLRASTTFPWPMPVISRFASCCMVQHLWYKPWFGQMKS